METKNTPQINRVEQGRKNPQSTLGRMVKMLKKITVYFLGVILTISLFVIPVYADHRYVTIDYVLGSATTNPAQPVGYLIDGKAGTSWGFKPGSNFAHAEIYLQEKALIYGLELTGTLAPETELTIEYEQEGQWYPFLASHFTTLPANGLLDLSYDRVETKALRLSLRGSGMSSSYLSEVRVRGEDSQHLRRRISPQAVFTSADTLKYAPAEHLTDGNTYTLWQTTPGTSQGEVMFQFTQAYTLETVKIYLSEQSRGSLRLETINGTERQVLTSLNVYGEQGWRELVLTKAVTTSQVRLVMTGEAVGLAEVEFWGYGPDAGDRHYPLAELYPLILEGEDINLEFIVPDDYGAFTPLTSLKVLYRSSNPSLITNSIQHQVRLFNNGMTPIDLSTVKIKYWYSKEPVATQTAHVYWATVGKQNITTEFIPVETDSPEANHCLVLGFTSEAGILGPGTSTEIQIGFNATNWANYNQGNDYSFLAQSGNFVENLNYPAYVRGQLVWGVEPPGSSSQDDIETLHALTFNGSDGEAFGVATNPVVSLLYKSANPDTQTNNIQHHLRLVNTGQSVINLADLKLRYWYTNEPCRPQQANIYWASCGGNNVTARFNALTEVTRDADYCLELGFTNNAGILRPNEHVEIQLGFNPADWSTYNQENDYSFMPETHDFVANEKYTVYHQQKLCWGKEPKHRPQITAGKNRALEYHLELAFLGESTKPLPIELNGEPLSLYPSLFLNGHTIYSYPVTAEALREEQNFLRLKATGETRFLSGARLTKRNQNGELPIEGNGLTDRLLMTAAGYGYEEEITLLEKLLLEKITIWGEEGFYAYLEVKKGENWVALTPAVEEEDKLTFTTSIITDQIRVRNSGTGALYEVQLFGSPITNQAPTVKILWPANGEEIFQNGWGDKTLNGLVDNPESQIYVNGIKAEQDGHYFTIKLTQLGLKLWETNKIIVTARDPEGRERTEEILVLLGKSGDYSIDQPDQLVYTDQETFRISGRVQQPNKYQVTVNGSVVPVNNRLFSTDVPLVEGLNVIKITFSDQTKGVDHTYYRSVVKKSSQLRLTVNQPQVGTYTAEPTIVVSGIAIGVGQVKVAVNGAVAQLHGGYYHIEIPLMEGDNRIIVQAVDERGATVETEVVVTRDSTPPVITEVLPADGFLSASELVKITGKIIDQSPFYVYVGGNAAVLNGELFSTQLTFTEGWTEVEIEAQDLAGNSSSYMLNLLVDTTPPEPFTVTADPDDWTNNPQPIITFGTTDTISGIDYYELAINNGAFIRVESPYQLAPQPDGEHTVTIKAVDKAGWATTASTKIYIDTTPPAVPEGFEVISGIERVILQWDNSSEEIIGYRVYRTPAFPGDNLREIWLTSGEAVNNFIDYEVETGNTYSYALQAIDRAYNIGQLSEEQQVMVGITMQEVSAEEGGNLKFDECEILLPANALPITRQVVVAEMPLELPENNYAVPVGPVYSALILDENNNEVEDEFSEPVTMVFSYEDLSLPDGYDESDLGVYWFNEENGQWEKLDYAWNNIEEKKIYVQVQHFSEYQLMASKYASPSLQSYYDLGVSPFQSYFNTQQENVSPSSGSLTISATDLILPGRDGFDFIIQRLYDSAAAQQEKLLETNGEDTHKAPIDTFGYGWSLNIPWIETTDQGSFIHLPEGQTVKIEMKDDHFEYHEGIHFQLKQEVKKTTKTHRFLFITWTTTSRTLQKYILTLKDGTTFEFDPDGRPTKKISPSNKNEIHYAYNTSNKREIKKITDSVGREVEFTYKTITFEKENKNGTKKTITKRVIEQIKVNEQVIEYDYDDKGRLISVKDSLDRETAYQYNTTFDCKEGYGKSYTLDLLDQITYPTGGVSRYIYQQLTASTSESDRTYYSLKIVVKEHQIMGKITEYSYDFLPKSGSLSYGTFVAPYTYISGCTIKERVNDPNNKGGKIVQEKYDHVIDNELLSKNRNFRSDKYKGSLLTSRSITLEDNSGVKKEYETVEYEYDIPIRAITKERYKRNNQVIYEITSAYQDAAFFGNKRWGNLTSRIDGRTKLEETYTYTNHSRIKNLVQTKTVKNWNELTKSYSTVVTSYEYDTSLGKPLTMTVTADDEVLKTSFTYDEYGNLATKTEPNNLQTVIVYGDKKAFPAEKRLKGVRDADGRLLADIVTRYGYSLASGMKEWEEDPRGYRTTYEYDLLNRLTKVILPDDDQDPLNNPYREYIFDDRNNNCDFYNENQHKTTFNFDELGRLVSVIKQSSVENKTEYVYDGLGRIKKVIDPRRYETTYEYDYLDRVTKIVYPDQSYARLEYDDSTNTVTIYEQDKIIAKERSDWSGRLIAAVQYCHYEGSTKLYNWLFTYDARGNKIRQINPYFGVYEYENQTDYYFDALGRMQRQQLPSAALLDDGSTEPDLIRPERHYKYDKMGNLIEETDSRGNTIKHEYDLLNRLVKTITESTDGFGRKTRVETKNYYDPAGNKIRTTIVDAANPEVPYRDYEYTFSARGFLLSEDIVLARDADGLATRKQNIVRYRYDALGNKIATIDPRNNFDAPLTWYRWENGRPVPFDPREQAERTYTTWYLYNDLNQLYRTVLPDDTPPANPYVAEIDYDNLYTETKYDANGNPVEQRDASGLKTSYTYTPRNWVETVSVNGELQEKYVYDHQGNKTEVHSVTETENVLDKIVRYKYDSLGQLRQVNYPLGEEKYDYDSVGNRIAVTDGRGNTTRYKYNGLGWLTEVTDPLFNTTRYQYDLNGNQVVRIAANQLKTSMQYDELNRLIRQTDSQNYVTRYSYDPAGNLARKEDPRGTLWQYEYLPNNLLREMFLTGAEGDTYRVSYTYDAAGNRLQVTDDQNTIDYHPDSLNRLTAIDRHFDGAAYHTGYQYEKNLLAGVKYPGSNAYLEYTYNERNLISGVIGFTQSISYHADGSLKETRYANGTLTTYEYDQNRRLIALTATNNGLEILKQQYQFDLAGNITAINDRSYEYDAKNQLIRSYTPGEFMEEEEKTHLPGLREADYLGNAAIDFTVDSQAVMHLDYNSSSIGLDFGIAGAKVKKLQLVPQLTTATHRLTANTIEFFTSYENSHYQLVKREDWEFEKDGQGIITITFKEVITTRYLKIHVRFDDRDTLFNPVNKATFLNQLSSMVRVYQQASERTEEYQYDAAGNRKKLSLRLVELFHYDYVYYENSDRLKSDGKYTYSYDAAGNLIRKIKIEVKEGEEPEDWEYEYDLLNRLQRVRKNGKIVSEYQYDPEGFRVVKKTAEQTIHYVFEGTEPIFEKNVTTGQIKSYVYVFGKHLARVDGVIGDPEAKVYFYHTDHLGSIKAVTDMAGEVVWNADYLAFGTRFGMAESSGFEEWHGFTGKEYDPDTGLYYFNARWYDSELGRFISEDPAADPNNPNLYAYGRNNPLRIFDSTGMWSEEWGYGYTGWHIRGSISDIMPSNSDSNTGSESSSSSLSEPTWNRYEYGNNPQFDLRCMLDFGLPYPEVGTDYNWFVNFYDEFIADIESSVSKSVGRVPGEMFGDLFDLGWDLLDAISEEGTEIPLQRQKKINQIFYEWNQRFKNSYTKFIGFGVSGYQYNSIEAKVMNITDTLITDGLSRLIDVFAQDSTGTLSSLLVPRTPHYDPDDIILNIAVAYKYDDFTPKDGTLKFGHFGSLFNHRELKDSYYLMNMEVQIRQNQIIEASLNIWEYSPNPLTFNTKSKLFRQLGMSTY